MKSRQESNLSAQNHVLAAKMHSMEVWSRARLLTAERCKDCFCGLSLDQKLIFHSALQNGSCEQRLSSPPCMVGSWSWFQSRV
eukprot:6472827-Amphidinium_carterae.3